MYINTKDKAANKAVRTIHFKEPVFINPSSFYIKIAARNNVQAAMNKSEEDETSGSYDETKVHSDFAFFHPDYTVGTGIEPVQQKNSARGLVETCSLYRRWGITPRPEDIVIDCENIISQNDAHVKLF